MLELTNLVFSSLCHTWLKNFLQLSGRQEDIELLSGCFHLGPFEPENGLTRSQWLNAVLELNPKDCGVDDFEQRCNEINLSDCGIVAWVNFSSSEDYANYLEWLTRFRDKDFELVEIEEKLYFDDQKRSRQELIISRRHKLDSNECRLLIDNWKILCAENSAFRLVVPGERRLASEELDTYDKILLRSISTEWVRASQVVGQVLRMCRENKLGNPGDLTVFIRIKYLSAVGVVELRGDPPDLSHSMVKLTTTLG